MQLTLTSSGRSGRSRESCIRTSPTRRVPTSGSARSPRHTKSSRMPTSGRSTTATGTRAFAAAASSRPSWTSGASRTSSRRSSARTCSARARCATAGRRGEATSRPSSRSTSRMRSPERESASRSTWPSHASAATPAAPSRTPGGRPARPAGAPGCCDGSRATCSASSSASGRARSAPARVACSSRPCTTCRGEGRIVSRRRLEVDVPAGIHDGQRVRIRGAGHAPFRGGERGDAYVGVRVRPDSRFVRDGNDLHTSVRLTMTDAALGKVVRVPGVGGDLDLSVTAGVQPGDVKVIERRRDAVARGHATRAISTCGSTSPCPRG